MQTLVIQLMLYEGEGQYFEAVFNRGTQGAEHKEMCRSGGRKCSWV